MMKKSLIVIIIYITCSGIILGQRSVDYLLKGKALVESGKPAEAVLLLNEAVAGSREESSLFLSRAEAYMANGDYSMAINDLNEANRISPASAEYELARIWGLKGEAATAVYHLEMNLKSPYKKAEKEIMLDPSFSLVENKPEWRQFWKKEWYGKDEQSLSEIEFYLSKGNIAEARRIHSDLISEYQGSERSIYSGALVNMAEKNYPAALKSLSQLLSENPENFKYLQLMAKAQEASGNAAGASTTYSRLLELGVAEPEIIFSRAECFRKTGEMNKALADAQRYLDLYPESKKGLSFAGKLEAASGDNLKALEYFTENLKLHPNDAGCYVDRANSYFVSGSWDWAINDYSMSLDLEPGNPEAWLNKGISRINKGNREDACHDFRKSFSLGNKRAAEFISKYCIK